MITTVSNMEPPVDKNLAFVAGTSIKLPQEQRYTIT